MSRILKQTLLASVFGVAISLGTGAAYAAEQPPASGYDWSGLYGGLHLGYGIAAWSGQYDGNSAAGPLNLNSLDADGVLGGAQIGYNFQLSPVVLGLEADISGADLKESISRDDTSGEPEKAQANTNFLASIRARGGIAFNKFLLSGTSGIAFTNTTLIPSEIDGGVKRRGVTRQFNRVGGVVGAGLEWAAWQNISLRIQYLYYIFQRRQFLGSAPDGDSGDHAKLKDIHAITLGINYHIW